jgi:hypothetical protein
MDSAIAADPDLGNKIIISLLTGQSSLETGTKMGGGKTNRIGIECCLYLRRFSGLSPASRSELSKPGKKVDIMISGGEFCVFLTQPNGSP